MQVQIIEVNMRNLLIVTALISLSLGASAQTMSEPHEALFVLANYENMPRTVTVFQSRSRVFLGKIEVRAGTPITCTHTEKNSVDSKPITNTVTQEGEFLEFNLQRYVDHDLICALKDKSPVNGEIDISVTYLTETLPDTKDELWAKATLKEWLAKSKSSQFFLQLDLPPKFCEEKLLTNSVKVETGFIYRMSKGGEACGSPVLFNNGNVISFCSKKSPEGEYDIEARGFSPTMQPLSKSLITEIETDTLRPRLLKTKLDKEMAIIHGLSGKIAAIDNTGKKVFELQLPAEWITGPTISGENIYVASLDGNGIKNFIYVINAQGQITGKYHVPGEDFSRPLIMNKQILIGNNLGNVLVLSHSGEIIKTIALASQLSHPGGKITHLFLNKTNDLIVATDKGEILKLDTETEDALSLYLAPNDGKRIRMGQANRDRSILDTPLVTKNGSIIFITDTRIHFLKSDGSLDKIVESGNEFNLQSPVSSITIKGEELIWIGGMGHLYLMGENGLKKMEFSPFETHQSEAMAENYSAPIILPNGKILIGVYFGLRWFKLSDTGGTVKLENSLNRICI